MSTMELITTPEYITFADIKTKLSMSPQNYEGFIIKNRNKKQLRLLLSCPIRKGKEVGSQAYVKNSKKYFTRTKALQPEFMLMNIEAESIIPLNPKFFRNYNLKEGDILISKDSNVGEVIYLDKDLPDNSISAGINMLGLSNDKYYILGFLKNEFFKKQLELLISKGATIKHAKDKYLECYIPFTKNKTIVEKVSTLVKKWIEKEKKIRDSFEYINQLLDKEVFIRNNDPIENLNGTTFEELSKIIRFDTGIYSDEYKEIVNKIIKYPRGYFTLPSNQFKSGSTPKNRILYKGIKKWVTPTIVCKYGYIVNKENIICDEQNIKKNCILIVNRTSKEGIGEYVGISFFYDFSINGIGHHNQGFYRIDNMPDIDLKLISLILNSKNYRKICGLMSLGSKMKEMKIKNFTDIPFPKLNDNAKKILVTKYDEILKDSEELIIIKQDINQYILKISNDDL